MECILHAWKKILKDITVLLAVTHYCRVRLQLIFVQFFTVIDLQQMFSYLHFYMNGMVLDWGPCEQL